MTKNKELENKSNPYSAKFRLKTTKNFKRLVKSCQETIDTLPIIRSAMTLGSTLNSFILKIVSLELKLEHF